MGLVIQGMANVSEFPYLNIRQFNGLRFRKNPYSLSFSNYLVPSNYARSVDSNFLFLCFNLSCIEIRTSLMHLPALRLRE